MTINWWIYHSLWFSSANILYSLKELFRGCGLGIKRFFFFFLHYRWIVLFLMSVFRVTKKKHIKQIMCFTHTHKKNNKKKISWYKQQSFVLQDIIRTSHFTTITVSLHLISCYIKINLGDSCLVCHAAYWSYFFLFQGKQRVLKYCCMGMLYCKC